jgi:hypothetical protein
MTLTVTLMLMALCAALFAFAAWRAGRPTEPPKVRMIPWTPLTILIGAMFLFLLAHVFTLFGFETGQMMNRF